MDFLKNLLMGVTKPVRGIAERGNILAQMIGGAVQGKDVVVKPKFGTEEELKELYNKPIKSATKDIASLAAWTVPVGKGIGGLAKSGAISGALGGYGSSKPGKEIESALIGAGSGAALGALLGIGNKALSKVKPQSTLDDIAKVNSSNAKSYIQSLNPVQKKALEFQAGGTKLAQSGKSQTEALMDYARYRAALARSGESSALTSGGQLESTRKALEKLSLTKSSLLDDVAQLDPDTITRVKDTWSAIGRKGVETAGVFNKASNGKLKVEPSVVRTYEKISSALDSLGSNPTAKQLDDLATKFGELAFKKASGKRNISEELYRMAQKAIRKELENTAKVRLGDDAAKILGQTNEDISVLLTRAKDLSKGAERAAKPLGLQGTISGFETPVKLGPISEGVQSLAGRGLEKVTKLKLPSRISPLTQKSVLGGSGALSNILFGTQLPQTQEEVLTRQKEMLDTEITPEVDLQQQFLQSIAMASSIMPRATAQQQLALAKILFELGNKGSGTQDKLKLSEADKDYVTAQNVLYDVLDLLESDPRGGYTGKIPTFTTEFSEFFGRPTKSTEYKQMLNTAVASVRKALIGAGQTEKELRTLNFPKPTDEPEVAKRKIRALIKVLERRPVGSGGVIDQSLVPTR